MSKRSQTYIKMPWTGGVNDSLDSGLIPDNDLVTADNVTFGISNSRLKREGINYFDQLTTPTASSVTRAGTTVTITFATQISGGSNDVYFVGEKLNITCADSEFTNATATVTAIPTNFSMQYTVSGTPTAASTTLSSITRLASIIGMHDFWSYDPSSDAKNQYILAVNSDAQVVRYTVAGARTYLSNKTESVTFTDAGYLVTLTAHGRVVGDAVSFTVITTTTGIAVNTTYFVATVPSADTFTLSATRGGSVLPLTTNGTGTMVSPLYTTSINSCAFLSMGEACIITFDGIGNYPKVFAPQVSSTQIRGLLGACPNASIICPKVHLGRGWVNDKEIKEQFFYSATYDYDKWNGYDDSGVLNIGFGDGDPDGINAIHPPFRGSLFLTKRDSTYRVDGADAESFVINPVSHGLGGTGHQAVAAVDMDDVVYVSYKGIHSLATTANYGDFSSSFLSSKIQTAFNSWTPGNLNDTRAVHIPTLNSVFFSVATAVYDDTNLDALWVFNTKNKEWHRWPNIQAKSISMYDDGGTKKLLLGRYDGRLAEAQTGDFVDYTTAAIEYKIQSGTIYVDGNPNTVKAFKKVGFIFRPKGDYTFTATVKIDNYSQQALAFSQVSGGAVLSTTFTLGTSILAVSNVLAPHMLPIDGYGRGITVRIDQNAADQQVELYGLVIEWEPADTMQENIGSQDLNET